MPRDTQRSRVYEWERRGAALERRDFYAPKWESLADVITWVKPIWRSERGRYGRAGAGMPAIERPAWGQRRALAYTSERRITLPRWARSPWVMLHELAHTLISARDIPHGPRFMGVLIGLVCRHLEYDATELMRIADEAGVKYDVRSIGTVPVRGVQWRAQKALEVEGPMSPMDLACWLSLGSYHEPVTARQVRGAMLGLVRAGKARLLRGKYRVTDDQQLAGADAIQFGCNAFEGDATSTRRRRKRRGTAAGAALRHGIFGGPPWNRRGDHGRPESTGLDPSVGRLLRA
jgi:putative metallohydrolase (TIGR04338 family)